MFLPYDADRIQEIKDLLRDRFWQSNYEECIALRSTLYLLEKFEAQSEEISTLNLVLDQALGGNMWVDGIDIFIRVDGMCFFVGNKDTKPELYEYLSAKQDWENLVQ